VLIMGAIYLVRHGQAAFGTDDYDRLTEIGYTQARLLGGFFAVRRVRCDAIYTGTLRRHTETVRGILATALRSRAFPVSTSTNPKR
jgi:broad specificity phosphatase PhoE